MGATDDSAAIPPWVIGHRGARAVAPENSIEGFRWAVDHGLSAVELDVRATADEVLVVVHDETLLAYGGPARPIAEQTADEVTAVVLRSGTRVPRLTDVLDLAEGVLAINVEVKNHPAEDSYDPRRRAAALLADLLDARHAEGHGDDVFAVSSFDPGTVAAFTERSSTAADRGALLTPPGRDPRRVVADAQALGVTAVHPHYSTLLRPGAGARLRDAGLTVRTWTVGSARLAASLRRAGAVGVVTDDPLRLVGR